MKNTYGEVTFTFPHWCFSRFLNHTNGTKLRKASYLKITRGWEFLDKEAKGVFTKWL